MPLGVQIITATIALIAILLGAGAVGFSNGYRQAQQDYIYDSAHFIKVAEDQPRNFK